MTKRKLLLATAALLSIESAQAGTPVITSDSKDKDKLISPAEPEKTGGFYFGIFGGSNLSQSSDPKQMNQSDARPRTYGSPAEIAGYSHLTRDIPPANADLIPTGTTVTSPAFSTGMQSNTGWMAGIKLGYVIPTRTFLKPAVELEAFYNGLDTVGSARSTKAISGLRTLDAEGAEELGEPFRNPDAAIGPSRASASFHDSINSAVFMLNGIVNFEFGRIRPYIGGGVGLAYVTHSFTKSGITADAQGGRPIQLLPKNHSASQIEAAPLAQFAFGSDNETTFAWQGLAGVDFRLTQHISVFAEYKALFYLDGPYYRNLLNNSVIGGLKYNF